MLRLAATFMSVAALALMIIPLYVKQQQVGKTGVPIILLTPAYEKDSVASFRKAYPSSPVYFYKIDNYKSGIKGAVTIDHLLQLKRKGVNAIHLFGEGLETEELSLLNDFPIVFHPTTQYPGINAISWNKQVVSGEPLRVQGTWFNTTSSLQKIVLMGFNSPFDSLIIPPNTSQVFRLSTIPKNTGKAIFSIDVLSGKDTIAREPLPVEVIRPLPLSVLVLASSPDFENKFLKNWLAGHAYKVAIRTAISRNKYSKEFVNLAALPVTSFQSTTINQFDVVIADAKALKKMSPAETGVLQNSIDQKGVGLIIKADSSLPTNGFYNRNFGLISIKDPESKALLIHAADTGFRFKPLQADGILYLRSTTSNQPVFYDQQNHPLVSEALFGSGKILIQPVANTYQWVLSGNKQDYEKFWSTLLSAAAKQKEVKEFWYAAESLPVTDKPVSIQLMHATDTMPVAQVGTDKVYLQQNATLPYKWNGTYWPRNAGWQTFIATDGNVVNWYVFDKNNYRNLQSIQKVNITQQNIKGIYNARNTTQAASQRVPISLIWFFFLFVLSAGFLWVEKKFL